MYMMLHGKFCIVFAFVLIDAAFAQQVSRSHVTVHVTDVTGANVPKALIEVASSHNTQKLALNADGNGKAEFDLPFGNYELLVRSPGFCPFRRFLEPLALPNQIVTAKLQIASCPGPCSPTCVTVNADTGVKSALAPQGLLRVIATDEMGETIQGADIEAISTLPGKFARPWSVSSITNTLGEVTFFDLPSGNYILSVSAKGFRKCSAHIEGGTGLNQTIRAKLAVANNNAGIGPTSCNEVVETETTP
jgi:hypothetical protein